MFNKVQIITMPITAVNSRHIEGEEFEVGIIVSGFSEELGEEVNAATSFTVHGEDNIPYRGDEVQLSVSEGEASIIWEPTWK